MNKQIKMWFMLITYGVVYIFVGCSRITAVEENTSETTTPIETTTAEEFEEYEKARQNVDTIIQALNDKDSEQLKSVLTDVTLQETSNLDEEIQCVFDMLDGEIVEVKENDVHYKEQ